MHPALSLELAGLGTVPPGSAAWCPARGGRQAGTGPELGRDRAGELAERSRTLCTRVHGNLHGSTLGMAHADFNERLTPINSYNQGSSSGSYTAHGGESLSSIAAAMWGDASLWYKLAAANGLGADTQLPPGRILTIPAGVMRNINNASTFRAYDPLQAYGAPRRPPRNPRRRRRTSVACSGRSWWRWCRSRLRSSPLPVRRR